MDNLPRRICVDRLTPAELAIREAMIAVEKSGAHPLLTDAVLLLCQAQDKVGDYVDGWLVDRSVEADILALATKHKVTLSSEVISGFVAVFSLARVTTKTNG